MTKIPDKIYLQIFGADKEDLTLFELTPASEITWCSDKIFDTDVEYVRKPYVSVSNGPPVIADGSRAMYYNRCIDLCREHGWLATLNTIVEEGYPQDGTDWERLYLTWLEK